MLFVFRVLFNSHCILDIIKFYFIFRYKVNATMIIYVHFQNHDTFKNWTIYHNQFYLHDKFQRNLYLLTVPFFWNLRKQIHMKTHSLKLIFLYRTKFLKWLLETWKIIEVSSIFRDIFNNNKQVHISKLNKPLLLNCHINTKMYFILCTHVAKFFNREVMKPTFIFDKYYVYYFLFFSKTESYLYLT